MKDDIKLPLLPKDSETPASSQWEWSSQDMQDYARAAIKADRQQRGELVAHRVFYRTESGGEWSGGWQDGHPSDDIALEDVLRIEYAYSAAPSQDASNARGWKEAAIAWEVCASIHREWAKGKDALFNTRQSDFTCRAEEARAAYRTSAPAQGPSDDDLLAIQEEYFPSLALWRSRYLEVARAILARYGTTVSCQIYDHPLQTCGECNHEKSLPVTQKGDMRLKGGKMWACTDPNIDRWVCADDRDWKLVPVEPTPEMVEKGIFSAHGYPAKHRVRMYYELVWEGMLEAAPKFGEEE